MKRSFFLLLLLSATIVHAQTPLRNELAIDAAPLFHVPRGFTLMYRHHLTRYAVRLTGNIYYDNSTTDEYNKMKTPVNINSSASKTTDTKTLNTGLRLGLQRNLQFDRWTAYGGADIIYLSTGNETNTETTNPGLYGKAKTNDKVTATTSSTGLAMVLGVSYRVHERISISLENSFPFVYTQSTTKQTTEEYFTDNNGNTSLNSTITTTKDGSGSKFDLSPTAYLRLFIGFRF